VIEIALLDLRGGALGDAEKFFDAGLGFAAFESLVAFAKRLDDGAR
jgi:hypothetical protein